MARLFVVAAGGAVGAIARYALSVQALRLWGSAWPYGTLIANVSGGRLMGALVGFLAHRGGADQERLRLLLGVGVLGGFTTFSAFSLELVQMMQRGALGVALEHALWACAQLTPVPGRMERITSPGQPMVAVDYSHTTDALEKALQALAPMAKERGGKLWCVFGCGGNRDASKRPHMGAAAQRLADEVVVTSDNPRNEEPMSIIGQILKGTQPAATLRVQADRALAIAETLAAAAPADVVLIAGKGHEDYQEVQGERHHFSDIEQARAALLLRGGAA